MKALSIRQPWCWAILNAGKDIENRRWRTCFRGTVLIHAASGMSRDRDYLAAIVFWTQFAPHLVAPAFEQLQRGGIVGQVDIVDCVQASSSPWFFGPFGFVLANPKPLPFRPLKGALGFFEVPNG